MRALLAIWVLVGLGGCCVLEPCVEAGESSAPPEFEAPAAVATPGCDPDDVRAAGDVVCAACTFEGGGLAPVEICGGAAVAPCETRENAFGEACQLCVVPDTGAILYDDCRDAAVDAVAGCEDVVDDNTGESCRVCFDKFGAQLTSACGPIADACVDVVDAAGRACRECTRDGALVSRTCDGVDVDPASCTAYGNELGRCVDCRDETGALLSHACVREGSTARTCEQTITPEGLACTVCVDDNGTPLTQDCSGVVTPERCELLAFSEQSCVICVDAVSAIVHLDCVRNDCAVDDASCRTDADCATGLACFDGVCVDRNDGSEPNAGEEDPAAPLPPACEAPPACDNSIGVDGQLCRSCPVTAADGSLGAETLCLSSPRIRCVLQVEGTSAEGDVNDVEQGRTCSVCTDVVANVEVYRDCAGNGNVTPPICVSEANGAAACTVCYDAVDNSAVYTTCPESPAGETCFALDEEILVDTAGVALGVDGADARVSCKQCSDASEADSASFASTCALENVCADPYGSSFSPGAVCTATETLALFPSVCTNPWDAHRAAASDGDAADFDELQAVIAYLLDVHSVAIGGAQLSVVGDATGCAVDDCACQTGRRIDILVEPADVDAVRAALAR